MQPGAEGRNTRGYTTHRSRIGSLVLEKRSPLESKSQQDRVMEDRGRALWVSAWKVFVPDYTVQCRTPLSYSSAGRIQTERQRPPPRLIAEPRQEGASGVSGAGTTQSPPHAPGGRRRRVSMEWDMDKGCGRVWSGSGGAVVRLCWWWCGTGWERRTTSRIPDKGTGMVGQGKAGIREGTTGSTSRTWPGTSGDLPTRLGPGETSSPGHVLMITVVARTIRKQNTETGMSMEHAARSIKHGWELLQRRGGWLGEGKTPLCQAYA